VLELDVGLHRGGFVPGQNLADALEFLSKNRAIEFVGVMGYETHTASVPTMLGWRDRERAKAEHIYREAINQIGAAFGSEKAETILRNAGGSKTAALFQDTQIANEVCAGSVLVKPTDFDHPLLAGFEPALFIATPILKGPLPTRIPAMGFLNGIRNTLRPGQSQSIYIHGGHWLAEPVHPAGLHYNRTVGRSSNQELLTCGSDVVAKPGDFAFFRPHQSEAVMMQFGDLAVLSEGSIKEYWPVWPASA